MQNPWIEWRGGECPVDDETIVEVRFGDDCTEKCAAGTYSWRHSGDDPADIVAYRVITKHKTAQPQQSGEVDPTGRDQHAPGAKLDAGKIMPWLCISGFAHALSAVADVTTKGAVKYTPNGWASVPNGEQRYMEAFGRHTLALARGEQIDADTDCLHKAQMIWNLLASLELELRAANGWSKGAKK